MAVLLCSVGILLLELGLHFIQIAIVFALFVSSRVFASLVLWISLSHVILAYIFIVLTAYFFVLWVKRRRGVFFIVMLACAIVATFNREEAYTLPVVLPLLWLISSPDRAHWREVLLAAVSLFAIVCFHYWLWHFLIPEALSPHFTLGAVKMLLRVIGGILAARRLHHDRARRQTDWTFVGRLFNCTRPDFSHNQPAAYPAGSLWASVV